MDRGIEAPVFLLTSKVLSFREDNSSATFVPAGGEEQSGADQLK
jgi:hypothetical protein